MPLVPLERARALIEEAQLAKPPVVRLEVWKGLNMISAEDVRASRDVPSEDVAAMDGYAVRSEDVGVFGRLRISGKIFPGDPRTVAGRGEAVYVSTGAVMPEGADAVVRIEASAVREGYLVPVERVWSGKDVVRTGDVVRKGEIVLRKGEIVTPYHVGLLIKAGVLEIPVYRPRISIIAVGDELDRFDAPDGRRIRDSVSPMIIGLAGFAEKDYMGVVGDDVAEILAMVEEALSKSDLVITVGGTSVGEKDLVKPAVARIGDLLFEGVAVNVIKRCSVAVSGGKPIAILPGQCVAAAACFHEHVLHVISRMVGGELRVHEEAALGEDLLVDHRMDSLYLFKVRSGIAIPQRWGPGMCSELTKSNAMAVLAKERLYHKGERILVQRLMPYAGQSAC